MNTPRTPRDLPVGFTTISELADAYDRHRWRLTDHHHDLSEPLTAEQVAANAIAALVYLHEISNRALDAQWHYMVDALAAGATADEVAAALERDPAFLRVQIVEWNAEQYRLGLIDDDRHDEILRLASGAS